jgi:hypothetical protein
MLTGRAGTSTSWCARDSGSGARSRAAVGGAAAAARGSADALGCRMCWGWSIWLTRPARGLRARARVGGTLLDVSACSCSRAANALPSSRASAAESSESRLGAAALKNPDSGDSDSALDLRACTRLAVDPVPSAADRSASVVARRAEGRLLAAPNSLLSGLFMTPPWLGYQFVWRWVARAVPARRAGTRQASRANALHSRVLRPQTAAQGASSRSPHAR